MRNNALMFIIPAGGAT